VQEENDPSIHDRNHKTRGDWSVRLSALIRELRACGVEVSVGEAVDAAKALALSANTTSGPLADALAAALIKSHRHEPLFHHLFALFFGGDLNDHGEISDQAAALDGGQLRELARAALRSNDRATVEYLARAAVRRYATLADDRGSAGLRYEFQAADGIDLEEQESAEAARSAASATTEVDRRIARMRVADAANSIRAEIRQAVRQALAARRGAADVARTLRQPLPEDVVIAHASPERLQAVSDTIAPLGQKLAAAVEQRNRRRGPLDLARTMRHATSTGGVPSDLVWRRRRPRPPHLFVLADMSESVSAFAGFAIALVSSLHGRYSSVRSFAFIENMVEVTDDLSAAADPLGAARSINARTDLVWADGHSDYGRALTQFSDRFASQLTSRAVIIILGDARTNSRAPHPEAIQKIAETAGAVYWLNPDSVQLWSTADSVMDLYRPYLTAAAECRTLRQLAEFVDSIGTLSAAPPAPPRTAPGHPGRGLPARPGRPPCQFAGGRLARPPSSGVVNDPVRRVADQWPG
jgi:uncharacterized protein